MPPEGRHEDDLARPLLAHQRLAASRDGGFRGGVWDTDADVEYTFYGLGCLALLAVVAD